MEIYEVRYSIRGAASIWHSGDCYSTAGIFTQKSKAVAIEKQIRNIMDCLEERKYDTYIRTIKVDEITDSFLQTELDDWVSLFKEINNLSEPKEGE